MYYLPSNHYLCANHKNNLEFQLILINYTSLQLIYDTHFSEPDISRLS